MRIRPLLPLLLSTLPLPVVAADYSLCLTAPDSVSCIIEQAEFTRQRNAEIDASIARVERARSYEVTQNLTHCKTPFSRSPRCLAERAQRFATRQNALAAASIARVAEVRAFEAARNAEITASIAAVEAVRTHRLETQQNALIEASIEASNSARQRRFEVQQNVLATLSMGRVAAERQHQLAMQLSPCNSPEDDRPRCEAQRSREFDAQQNALATASLQRVKAERTRAFAAARNAEIEASIAAVERNRAASEDQARMETASICQPYNWLTAACTTAGGGKRNAALSTQTNAPNAGMSADEYAALTSHCVSNPESPRCDVERIREFAAARNAEINASIAAVERNRAAAADQNRLQTASICPPYNCVTGRGGAWTTALSTQTDDAVAGTSADEYAALTSHCVRNPESPRCTAERIREFAAARNAEIERSMAAVAAARASGQLGHTAANSAQSVDGDPLETGAIGTPSLRKMRAWTGEPENELRHDISTDPCLAKPFDAVQFVRGTEIHADVKPELDRLAKVASACPGMRIEVHGYTDGGSVFNNRNLSQARAQAIADYLIAAGVAPNRVAAIGRGGRHPVMLYGKSFAPGYGRAEFVIRDPNTDAAARRVMWDLAELLDPTYIPAVANLSP